MISDESDAVLCGAGGEIYGPKQPPLHPPSNIQANSAIRGFRQSRLFM